MRTRKENKDEIIIKQRDRKYHHTVVPNIKPATVISKDRLSDLILNPFGV